MTGGLVERTRVLDGITHGLVLASIALIVFPVSLAFGAATHDVEPVDRLPWTPQHILSDLTGIPALAGV